MSYLLILAALMLPLSSFSPTYYRLYKVRKIVIDAGHGGHDPGCLGSSSKEKEVALAVSLKLGKLIEENLEDVQVIYTRKTDKFIELHERANIANRAEADLFICIHCNSGSATAYGAETYTLGLHRAKENLLVAKRENAAILMESNYKKNYDGFDPNSDEASIMFSLYQSAFMEKSINFAAKIQNFFRTKAKRHDRGVKQAGLLVLARTTMPGVLVETGFLTNQEEEKFLKDEAGQDALAYSLFQAVKEYKTEMDSKAGITAVSTSTASPSPAPNNSAPVSVTKPAEVVKDSTPAVTEVKTVEVNQDIVFKVQITTSTKMIPLKPENFNGLQGVSSYENSGIYRYTYGSEPTLAGAASLQQKAKESGFKDSFVVAFRKGERISITEALKELNK